VRSTAGLTDTDIHRLVDATALSPTRRQSRGKSRTRGSEVGDIDALVATSDVWRHAWRHEPTPQRRMGPLLDVL